jgi:nucleoside 2-deoxyribosyltransferase
VKVYLSVPMVANRALDRARLMEKAILDSGHQVSSPWVLGPLERSKPSELNIFERDKGGVEHSDAIVADVTDPSIGVGMELMAAHTGGKKVIVVAKKGKVTSGMLRHMEPKVTVEYDDETEIYTKLCEALNDTG